MARSEAPASRISLDVVEAQAGGDVGRVIMDGVADLPGSTVVGRAEFLQHEADGLRRCFVSPPHGTPSHCLNLIVPPADARADAGLIIMGTMGYPGFSGSNAMCAVAALAEAGRLPTTEAEQRLVLETPAGLSTLDIGCRNARVETVTYEAVPGFVATGEHRLEVEGWGSVPLELVYGGTSYVMVRGAEIGIDPATASVEALQRFCAALFSSLDPAWCIHHPLLGDLPPPSMILLAGAPERSPIKGMSVPLAVYMHPGVICRGPTGTGTTALLAHLMKRGELPPGTTVRTVSPFGNVFEGTLLGSARIGDVTGVRTSIRGHPRVLARSQVFLDEEALSCDPQGFRRLFEAPPGDGRVG